MIAKKEITIMNNYISRNVKHFIWGAEATLYCCLEARLAMLGSGSNALCKYYQQIMKKYIKINGASMDNHYKICARKDSDGNMENHEN